MSSNISRKDFLTKLGLTLGASAIAGKLLSSTDYLANEADRHTISYINNSLNEIQDSTARTALGSRLMEMYDTIHVCRAHRIGITVAVFKEPIVQEFKQTPGINADLTGALVDETAKLARSETKTAYELKESIARAKTNYFTEKGFDPKARGAIYTQPIQEFLQAQLAKTSEASAAR